MNEFLLFQVIIVTTSPSSTFVPNILSKSHNYAAVTKLVPTSVIASTTQKQPVVITASQSSLVSSSSSGGNCSTPSSTPNTIAVTAVVSSTPSVVMSTVAQGMTVMYIYQNFDCYSSSCFDSVAVTYQDTIQSNEELCLLCPLTWRAFTLLCL